MQFVIEWVTNIILFLLFAIVIDFLLPSGTMQKYVKMAIGLMLLLVMLRPVLQLTSIDPEQLVASAIARFSDGQTSDETIKNQIEQKKKEIQASQRAYILEQMAVQMEADVKEELMDQYGVAIDRIHIETKKPNDEPTADNIKSISVAVSKKASGDSEVVSAVKVISIDTSTPIETNKPTESKKLSNYLAAKWDVKQGQVVVNMEEGDTK